MWTEVREASSVERSSHVKWWLGPGWQARNPQTTYTKAIEFRVHIDA